MESWQAEERDGRAEQDRVRMIEIGGEKEQERETDREREESNTQRGTSGEGRTKRGESR